MQHPLHPTPAPHHTVPGLLSNHSIFSLPGSSAATALLIQRTNEEEKWLARQRRLRQEKEDRQTQVSEFRQQVLEQHLDMGRPPAPADTEHRPDSARWAPRREGGWGVFTLAFARSQRALIGHLLLPGRPLTPRGGGDSEQGKAARGRGVWGGLSPRNGANRSQASPHSLAASLQGQ